MTKAAILYNLNTIDLKLEALIRDKTEIPDCELSDKFKVRYCVYLSSIIDKCNKLINKYQNN